MVTKKASIIVKHFDDDRYSALFSPQSGFFARIEDSGVPEPFWSSHGPELLDIAITNWCDKGCSFCYRKSDSTGTHMLIEDYREVMRQAKEMHVFQVALGGGNPNQHPSFCEFLRITREEFGIVPNYTTNGRGLTEEVIAATAKYVGAVAVSAYAPYTETVDAVARLKQAGVTTNLHFILTSRSVETATDWLRNPPEVLRLADGIVFLNYKPVGRSADESLLLNKSRRIEEFFEVATQSGYPFRVGFDTCTITGLARLGKAPKVTIEGCDAGRFSLFVSESMMVYPCSYMVEAGYRGVSLRSNNLRNIWLTHPSFAGIRAKHQSGSCADCTTPEICLSGCPLFPEMNLCPSKCSKERSPFKILTS
jgi:radical SAM protein with 4Fe4S-binding SPASM domain